MQLPHRGGLGSCSPPCVKGDVGCADRGIVQLITTPPSATADTTPGLAKQVLHRGGLKKKSSFTQLGGSAYAESGGLCSLTAQSNLYFG